MELKHAQFIHCVKNLATPENRPLMECVVKGYVVNEAIAGKHYIHGLPLTDQQIAAARNANATLARDTNAFTTALRNIVRIVDKYGCIQWFNRLIDSPTFRNAIRAGNQMEQLNSQVKAENIALESIMDRQMRFMAFLESLREKNTNSLIESVAKAFATTESAFTVNFIPMFEAQAYDNAAFSSDVLTDDEANDENVLKENLKTVANFIAHHGTKLWNDFLNSPIWLKVVQSAKAANLNAWRP